MKERTKDSYLAPECCEPGYEPTEAADVFSLGLCMLETYMGQSAHKNIAGDFNKTLLLHTDIPR